MSFIDRDVILRQIRFLQQLLARVFKVQREQGLPTALAEVRNGYREVLGLPYELLSQVDASSALLMLRTPERRQAYLELLRAEAELQRTGGEVSTAESLERRATQVERATAS